jgi:hypothetical protein
VAIDALQVAARGQSDPQARDFSAEGVHHLARH